MKKAKKIISLVLVAALLAGVCLMGGSVTTSAASTEIIDYGNLLINIPRNSIHIGGGRDNTVSNNIIVNSGENAIYFDERAREGALNNGWFTHAHIGSGDIHKYSRSGH